MKSQLILVPVLLLGATVPICPAQNTIKPLRDETNYVSIESPAGGEPMLVVRYPWTKHKDPSVEVRTYVEGEVESLRVRPLHFRHDFMTPEISKAVYDCQTSAESVRTLIDFDMREIEFVGLGDRNQLGRAAVCLTCRTKVLKPNRELFPDLARRAAFPLLASWAVDDETLFLSLPDLNFAEPAKMRVFFLRGDTIVWSEAVKWPGLPKPAASEAPAGPAS